MYGWEVEWDGSGEKHESVDRVALRRLVAAARLAGTDSDNGTRLHAYEHQLQWNCDFLYKYLVIDAVVDWDLAMQSLRVATRCLVACIYLKPGPLDTVLGIWMSGLHENIGSHET